MKGPIKIGDFSIRLLITSTHLRHSQTRSWIFGCNICPSLFYFSCHSDVLIIPLLFSIGLSNAVYWSASSLFSSPLLGMCFQLPLPGPTKATWVLIQYRHKGGRGWGKPSHCHGNGWLTVLVLLLSLGSWSGKCLLCNCHSNVDTRTLHSLVCVWVSV